MEQVLEFFRTDRMYKLWFGACALLSIVLLGFAVSYSTLTAFGVLVTLAVLVPAAIWYMHDHRIGLVLVILSVIPGNLIRLSLSTDVRGGAAILLSDLAIPALVIVWLIKKFVYDKKFVSTPVNAPLIAFTVLALVSFVQGIFILDQLGTLNLKDVVIAFLYWGRWVEYALLFFITIDMVRTKKDINFFLRTLFITACIIAIGGYYQLIYFPDFTQFAILYGWDPHQDRLLSSFFDPNFVGGFLAFVVAILAGLFFYTQEMRKKLLYAIPAVIIGIALLFTFSRSGYLALLVSGVVIGILRSRVALVCGIILAVASVLMVPRALNRISEGLSVDETGVKRIESWTKALSIVPAYPIFGVGYDMLGTVQKDLGTVDEFDVNNTSGVENSFLTVLVTTGIVGLAAFAYMYFVILRSLYRNWKNEALADRWRGLNLGVFAAVMGLIAHSIFVHSLMYPFILIFLWVFIALALRSGILENSGGHKVLNAKR